MNHDVELFSDKNFRPDDYRWDLHKNGKLLNILYYGGTFGTFLKYFLERFSTKTPDMTVSPFTDIGTSHALSRKDFSGLIQAYHQSFINDNKGETNLPVCIIVPSKKKHYLYLKKGQWSRSGPQKVTPDDLWKNALGEMPERIRNYANNIVKLYDIKDTAHFSWIPKFIVRDWYKLEFLRNLEDTYNYQWFEAFKGHEFFKGQRVFELDLGAFFDWETFIENITGLNDMFDLSLDFDQQAEMKEIFNKGLSLDVVRQECNVAEDILERGLDTDLRRLDVATEAFIYAEMERKNDFIQMPLTNRFFRDTEEMHQFVEYYPNHYKAMNPNMPKFNGIPNPYHLHKNK